MTYIDDQLEGWFEGGREWYMKQNNLKELDYEKLGMPADFDVYLFWAEIEYDMDPNQANDMVDGNGDMIDMDLINGGE